MFIRYLNFSYFQISYESFFFFSFAGIFFSIPWISQRMGEKKKKKFPFPDKRLKFPSTQMVWLKESFYSRLLF